MKALNDQYPRLKFTDNQDGTEMTAVLTGYLKGLNMKVVVGRTQYDCLFARLKEIVDEKRSEGDHNSAEELWSVIELMENILERGEV